MKEEKDNYPIEMMARLLNVSKPGFYKWLKKPDITDEDQEFLGTVEQCWLDSNRVFGARRILIFMPAGTALYKVRKAMHALDIRGCAPNASKRTTIPDENAPIRPDLIKRDFTSPVPTYKLVGDITYLKTAQGWLYLATVIDLCTRMVVGWAMSKQMKAVLVVNALEMAK